MEQTGIDGVTTDRTELAASHDRRRWHPDVPLTTVTSHDRGLGRPFADFLRGRPADQHVLAALADVETQHRWERILHNNQGNVLARPLLRDTPAAMCRLLPAVGRAQ